ncbi:MAG: IMP dehydrogenase, partial [Deltaproteobacteria bacterium]|nr:IMP dehydrogenase [Deltaproteobacteria bacterium]
MKIRKKTFGFDDLLLVPAYSTIESRSNVDVSVDLAGIRLGCPVVSSNMDTVTEAEMATAMELLGGLGIIHRYLSPEARLGQLEKVRQLRHRAFAVGVTRDEIAFAKQLIDGGANAICLDVAHGHSSMMERALGELRAYADKVTRARFAPLLRPVFIAGNVATPEGAADLAKWGADVLKVGIGP